MAPRARRRASLTTVVAGVAALASAGCGGSGEGGQQRTVTDALGRDVPVSPPATRVVSLAPSATETVLALGAGDRMVARTAADEALLPDSLPDVGGGLDPSLETILAVRPDLVLTWSVGGDRGVLDRLAPLGIRSFAVEPRTLEEVLGLVRDVGRLLDLESASDSLVQEVDARLRSLDVAVGDDPRPTVFYAVWLTPPSTTGRGTFLDQLIRAAGGRNVFDDLDQPWPSVSVEELLRRDPDVILVSDAATSGALSGAAGWSSLRAVREGRVFVVDGDLFSRPGPRVAEAAWTLARLLHPRRLEAWSP